MLSRAGEVPGLSPASPPPARGGQGGHSEWENSIVLQVGLGRYLYLFFSSFLFFSGYLLIFSLHPPIYAGTDSDRGSGYILKEVQLLRGILNRTAPSQARPSCMQRRLSGHNWLISVGAASCDKWMALCFCISGIPAAPTCNQCENKAFFVYNNLANGKDT